MWRSMFRAQYDCHVCFCCVLKYLNVLIFRKWAFWVNPFIFWEYIHIGLSIYLVSASVRVLKIWRKEEHGAYEFRSRSRGLLILVLIPTLFPGPKKNKRWKIYIKYRDHSENQGNSRNCRLRQSQFSKKNSACDAEIAIEKKASSIRLIIGKYSFLLLLR